ncbi:unnamed protein product, partial [Linum tenue]
PLSFFVQNQKIPNPTQPFFFSLIPDEWHSPRVKCSCGRAFEDVVAAIEDSKIDELEKVQSELDAAKNRGSTARAAISKLQSVLEATQRRVRSKVKGKVKVMKATNELTLVVDQRCKNLEAIKMEADEQLRKRMKMKQVLRVRRQSLHSLQLTLRAMRIEAEAFATSAEDAAAVISMSMEVEYETVELTAEEEGDVIVEDKEDLAAIAGKKGAREDMVEEKVAAGDQELVPVILSLVFSILRISY